MKRKEGVWTISQNCPNVNQKIHWKPPSQSEHKNHDTLAKKTTETIFLYAKLERNQRDLELMTEVSSCCARPAASASAAAWFSDGEVLWQMQFRKEGNPNGLFSWGLKGLFFEVKIASLISSKCGFQRPFRWNPSFRGFSQLLTWGLDIWYVRLLENIP